MSTVKSLGAWVLERRVLLAILFLGMGLRLYDLGAENLWYDEVGTLDYATRGWFSLSMSDHVGFFYRGIMKFWILIFGVSEVSLRMPSVLFSAGALVMTYQLGKYLMGQKAALIGMFLLSISPFHIFYSQDATYYSLLVFLGLLSLYSCFCFLSDSPRRSCWLYPLSTVFMLYTSFLGLFIVLLENILFVVRGSPKWKRWTAGQTVIMIFFLAYLLPLIRFYFLGETSFFNARTNWFVVPSVGDLLETFATFCWGGARLGGVDVDLSCQYPVIYSLQCVLSGALVVYGFFPKKEFKNTLLLAVGILLPILTLFVFSWVFKPYYLTRYFIFALPLFYLLLGKGIERLRSAVLRVAVLIFIVVMISFELNLYYASDLKMRWGDAISYLDEKSADEDLIVVVSAKELQMFGYYGKTGLKNINDFKDSNPVLREDVRILRGGHVYYGGQNKWVGVSSLAQLKKVVLRNLEGGARQVWVVISRWGGDPEAIKEELNSMSEVKSETKFHGLVVLCCTRDVADPV